MKTETESVMSVNKIIIHYIVGTMRKICTRYYESTETVHLTYNSEKSYGMRSDVWAECRGKNMSVSDRKCVERKQHIQRYGTKSK